MLWLKFWIMMMMMLWKKLNCIKKNPEIFMEFVGAWMELPTIWRYSNEDEITDRIIKIQNYMNVNILICTALMPLFMWKLMVFSCKLLSADCDFIKKKKCNDMSFRMLWNLKCNNDFGFTSKVKCVGWRFCVRSVNSKFSVGVFLIGAFSFFLHCL